MISVPYTVYARVVPHRGIGKRDEYINDLNKIATFVKTNLDDAGTFVLAESQIAVTPQIGQYPARLTIVGFDNIDEDPFQPATTTLVDAPSVDPDNNYQTIVANQVVAGYSATQIMAAQGQSLDPRVRSYMLALKSALEAASTWLDGIYRLDYMGVIFGQRGYSFQ